MADGDLHMTLLFDDGTDPAYTPGPPDPTPPTLSPCGQELYDAMFPLAREDHLHGWMLAHLCEAIGRMRQPVSDIVRETDDGPGWSPLTDVDRAPGTDSQIDLLPALAQLVGVQLAPELDDVDRRAAIREREGFWRGRPASIISFAARYTDGTPGAVRIRERYNPALGASVDAPYHGQVLIKRSRLLPGVDETDLGQRVLARIPAGLIYAVVITDAADFEQVRQDFADFDDLTGSFTDFDDLTGYEGA